MLNTIIIIAAILILVILFAIFRVSSLVDVIKGDSSTKIPSSNGTQANLLLLFLIAGLVGGFYYSFGGLEDDFVLPVASKHGVITDTAILVDDGDYGCRIHCYAHLSLWFFVEISASQKSSGLFLSAQQ